MKKKWSEEERNAMLFAPMKFKGCIFEQQLYLSIYIEGSISLGGWVAPLGKNGEMIRVNVKEFVCRDSNEIILYLTRNLDSEV